MAPISKTIALAGALFAAAGTAAPLNRREDVVVWETVTDVVWTTVETTITITPGQTVAPVTYGQFVPVTTTTPVVATPSSSSSSSIYTPPPAPKTTTSPAPQPAPTSSSAPVVTSTPASEPAPTSASAPAPAPAAESGSSLSPISTYFGVCTAGSPCDGDGTYYDTATSPTNPSFCGYTNDGLVENVIALPVGWMQDSDCGRSVTVSYGGRTATATVVDKCMGCEGNSIDMSRHLFSTFGSLDIGRLHNVEWWFN
ncbi:hypothetical protein M432DRAFT_55194 [Thermoascus aurantiacus ATCC 26904]